MRRSLCLIWFCCCVLLPISAQTFVISGTVVDHASAKALKDAVVTIAPVEQPASSVSYRTGEDGHFAFAQLTPGKYSLSAKKRGYPTQSFQENDEYSTAIVVGPGLGSENLVFPLAAGGVITGIVFDEENEPVRQAAVMLFRRVVFGGMEQTIVQGNVQTNSTGDFRFSNLKAGTYLIAVQGRPWWAQNNPVQPPDSANEQANEREFDVIYPTTYSGGVTDPAAASPVTVTEGATSNLQFVLRAIPGLHIQVTGLPTIKPDMGVGFNLAPIGLGGVQPGMFGGQINILNERVEITGLAPGRYVVGPYISGEGHMATLGSGVVDLSGDGTLDVSAFRAGSLTGHMSGETNALPQNAMLLLRQANSQPAPVMIGADGSLKLSENSPPLSGQYEIELENAPGFYLKSVEAKGATVIGRQLEIPSGSAVQLELVAATGMSKIDGVALKDEKGVGGAMVLLIPKETGKSGLIRRDQSDSDGTFTLSEVAPGRYTLLAIDDGRELRYTDAAVMKPYLSQGTELTAPLMKGAAMKVEVVKRIAESTQ